MACFHPLAAWQLEGGEIVFVERGKVRRSLTLPCGRCIGCRLVRVRAWAIRCVHEAQMHPVNSFVTLTYDDAHYAPSLNYLDFQRFMYRLRRCLGPARFFVAGEYGELTGRPHFHMILFGHSFKDGKPCGRDIYSSAVLDSLWRNGYSSFGSVTYQSAAYVAKYACKKVTGQRADAHYTRMDYRTGELCVVVPEFAHMSLRPGIGYSWFQKYYKEVYVSRDGIVMPGGKVVPPPRFYDKLLLELDSDLKEFKDYERYVRSERFQADCTPDRLLTRELCALKKKQFLRSVL